MKSRNMKTRYVYQSYFERNNFFDSERVWNRLFRYKNPDFTVDECRLVEDICKKLSNNVERSSLEDYFNRLIAKGGEKYLQCAEQHLTDAVIPSVVRAHASVCALEAREPGRWREHIKAVSKEYTILSVNLVILTEALKRQVLNHADTAVQLRR